MLVDASGKILCLSRVDQITFVQQILSHWHCSLILKSKSALEGFNKSIESYADDEKAVK